MKILYGTKDIHIDVSDICYKELINSISFGILDSPPEVLHFLPNENVFSPHDKRRPFLTSMK